MPKKPRKPVLGFFSLTDCEGCLFAILDLGQRFFDLLKYFELGNFDLIEELPERSHYDIAFVEGTPVTKENFKHLKEIRKKSDFLISLGTCAHLGGIQQIKNWQNKNKRIYQVYKKIKGLNNPDIKPISKIVKVDFDIPQCPINNEEFLKIIYQLKEGRMPRISRKPVCYECQIRGYECLLQKGQPCLGPISVGGCEAICPANGMYCESCRGTFPEANIKGLRKIIGKKEFNRTAQTYGALDEIEEAEAKLKAKDKK